MCDALSEFTKKKLNDETGKRILKYLGDLNNPATKQLASFEHAVVEITPTTKTSWDYSKNRWHGEATCRLVGSLCSQDF